MILSEIFLFTTFLLVVKIKIEIWIAENNNKETFIMKMRQQSNINWIFFVVSRIAKQMARRKKAIDNKSDSQEWQFYNVSSNLFSNKKWNEQQ